ncbi:hypothetical protein ACV3SG_11935 [Clostridium perfringens]
MDKLLMLLKDYRRDKHTKILEGKIKDNNYNWSIVPIYDENWNIIEEKDLPYEVITQILDSYYCLPERIDLAFLFCWQSINNLYNKLILKDDSINKLSDKKGIDLLIKNIYLEYEEKYKIYLKIYIDKAPIKVFKFISNYILKGYVMQKEGYKNKYYSNACNSFRKRFTDLYESIGKSYGEAFRELCNPSIENEKVVLNIKEENIEKSQKIIHSLSKKLETLIKTKNVEFNSRNLDEKFEHNFNNEQVIEFMIVCILYAQRCSNFHGNVASRLNSIYANNEYYLCNKYIFLLSHIVVAILLNINGYLSDEGLEKLKKNQELL